LNLESQVKKKSCAKSNLDLSENCLDSLYHALWKLCKRVRKSKDQGKILLKDVQDLNTGQESDYWGRKEIYEDNDKEKDQEDESL